MTGLAITSLGHLFGVFLKDYTFSALFLGLASEQSNPTSLWEIRKFIDFIGWLLLLIIVYSIFVFREVRKQRNDAWNHIDSYLVPLEETAEKLLTTKAWLYELQPKYKQKDAYLSSAAALLYCEALLNDGVTPERIMDELYGFCNDFGHVPPDQIGSIMNAWIETGVVKSHLYKTVVKVKTNEPHWNDKVRPATLESREVLVDRTYDKIWKINDDEKESRMIINILKGRGVLPMLFRPQK